MRPTCMRHAHRALLVAVLSLGAALTACGGQAAQTATSGASSGGAASKSGSPTSAGLLVAALQEGQSLYGLSETTAKAKATAAGFEFQVIERDGRWLGITYDLRPRRIDAVIHKGVVVSTSAG